MFVAELLHWRNKTIQYEIRERNYSQNSHSTEGHKSLEISMYIKCIDIRLYYLIKYYTFILLLAQYLVHPP